MAGLGKVRPIFEELFVCSVCLQPFETPKLLPCLHSFCQNCIERHYQIDSKRRRATQASKPKLSCPSCRVLVIVPAGQVRCFYDDSSIEATREFISECFGQTLSLMGEPMSIAHSEETPMSVSDSDCAPVPVAVIITAVKGATGGQGQGEGSDASNLRESLRNGVMHVQATLVKLRCKIMDIVLLMDHLEELKEEQQKMIEEGEEENHAKLIKALHDSYRPPLARLGTHLVKLYKVACERKSVYGIVEELVEKGTVAQLFKSSEKVQQLLEDMQMVPAAVHIDLHEALGELDVNISDIELQIPHSIPIPVPESSLVPLRNKMFDVTKHLICRLSRAGKKPGQFNFPVHATFLPDGGFMVCDKKNERIQIFDKTGKFDRIFLGGKVKPRRARINPVDGLIYISNEHTECIKVYTMDGEYVRSIGENFFTCPAGLDFDSKGNILMTDAEKATVSIHSPDNQRLQKFAFAYFQANVPCPYFAAVNSEDSLIISDYRNNMVKVFTNMGRELFCIDNLKCPRGVCVDKDDNILIAEGDAHCISLYSPFGKFLQCVLTEDDGLQYPMSVEIDPDQRVLVTQFGVHRSEVMMFHLSYEAPDQADGEFPK